MATRDLVRDHVLQETMDVFIKQLAKRLKEKGPEAFISRHETLGVVTEEYDELLESVRLDADPQRFIDELYDIAVAAIFGAASMKVKYGL